VCFLLVLPIVVYDHQVIGSIWLSLGEQIARIYEDHGLSYYDLLHLSYYMSLLADNATITPLCLFAARDYRLPVLQPRFVDQSGVGGSLSLKAAINLSTVPAFTESYIKTFDHIFNGRLIWPSTVPSSATS